MRIGRDEANAGIACDCLGSDLLSFLKAREATRLAEEEEEEE